MVTQNLGSVPWRGQALRLRQATLDDVPAIVRFHRSQAGVAPPEERTTYPEAWFALGGPWMHPYFCQRHLQLYEERGFDVWLLVSPEDEVKGHIELWYAEEPEPFGRYGHPELIELAEEVGDDEVEAWLLERAEQRAIERGYARFWCRPAGSGGSARLLEQRGYKALWRNGGVLLRELSRFQPPRYIPDAIDGQYESQAAAMLALNHREAASYRWGAIWRPVLDPRQSDVPTNVAFWGSEVRFKEGGGGLCLVTIPQWRRWPQRAEADFWVEPERAYDADHTRALLSVVAPQALRMGAQRLIAYLPEAVAGALAGDELVEPLELEDQGAPWYLKLLVE